MNGTRVRHFADRIPLLDKTAADTVIVIINVDDPYGGPIAEGLMPGYNWQPFRDRNEIPFARGLANRAEMQEILSKFDKDAANKLEKMPNEIAVVVVDHLAADVFPASTIIDGTMMVGCVCAGWKKGLSIEFDSQDADELGWTACPYCKTPFRVRISARKKAAEIRFKVPLKYNPC